MRNYIIIFLCSILVLSCEERNYKNPFDPDVSAATWTPENFSVEIKSDSVQLSWDNSAVLDVNYKIFRKANDGMDEFSVIDSTGDKNYTDTPPFNNSGYVYSIRAYLDKKLSDASKEVAIEPISAGTEIWSIPFENNIGNTAFSDDGEYFVIVENAIYLAGNISTVKRNAIESQSGDFLWSYVDTVKNASCIDISSDNEMIAIGHIDGQVSIIDLPRGEVKWSQSDASGAICRQVQLTSDNQRLVTGNSNGNVKVWNTESAEILWEETLESSIAELKVNQNGNNFGVADYSNVLYSYNINTFALLWNVPVTNSAKKLAFSPDGNEIALGLIDGSVNIISNRNGSTIWTGDNTSGMSFDIEYNSDGSRLYSGAGYLLKLWNNGNKLWEINLGNYIHSISVSDNDELISVGGQFENLYIIDAETGEIKKQINVGSTIFKTGFLPNNQVVWLYYDNILTTYWAIDTWKVKE